MMARWLYTFIFAFFLPFIVLRLWWKGRKNFGYRQRLLERFGIFVAPEKKGGIWVHAVSVGETLAALPLIEHLLQRYPHLPITVTTTTPTGSERVKAALGDRVFHVYSPYDLPLCVNAFLRRVRPQLCLIMETELWPNMIAANQKFSVKTLLLNARLSRRSARGYRKIRWITRPMLQGLTRVAAQQVHDARRLTRVGLPPDRVQITGSIKSDVKTTVEQKEKGAQLRVQLRQRYTVIAASTHEGEEVCVIEAFKQLRQKVRDAVLIIVPRHPERFDVVFELALRSGLSCIRRTQIGANASISLADTAIYLADTMGELMALYAAADVAFVGGSLVPRGGHNLLEPAAWGLPIIQGPHTFNFAVLTRQFAQSNAVLTVSDIDALAEVWQQLADPEMRHMQGQRAAQQLETQRGALARVLDLIAQEVK